ncbi:MAG: hypothetical protein JXK05_13320 [Campylobacterales bacterium]|nr:hypothetical protein [Campylobacterales bacterium]
MKKLNQKELSQLLGISDRQVRTLVKKGILQPDAQKKFDAVDSVRRYANYRAELPLSIGMSADITALHSAKTEVDPYSKIKSLECGFSVEQFGEVPDVLREEFQADCVTANTVNSVLLDTTRGILEAIPQHHHDAIVKIIVQNSFDRALLQETFQDAIEALRQTPESASAA